MASPLPTLLLITLLPSVMPLVDAGDSLSLASSLSVEKESDVIRSSDGTFSCGFYNISSDAFTFSIWFSNSADKTVVWTANPLQPVHGWGSKVTLHKDGTMVLKNFNGDIVWKANGRSGSAINHAQLLKTGNLVLKDQVGNVLWQSFDSPTDTLLPTQPITANTKLISSSTLLLPGRYSFRFSDEYLLSLFYLSSDSSKIYWPDPHSSIGDKGRKLFNSSRIGVLNELGQFLGSDGLNFTASDMGPGIKRRLTLDYDGNVRLYSLNESDGQWSVSYMAFSHLYFVDGLCGMNGILIYSLSRPLCLCPPGYKMSDPEDWSKGCDMMFNITCVHHEEVNFVMLPFVDFAGPDMSVTQHISLEACMDLCRTDCSCKAIRYVAGSGLCYTKPLLLTGKIFPWHFSSLYLKLPRSSNVSKNTFPHSGLLASRYNHVCSATATKVLKPLPEMHTGGEEKSFIYFYGFLSALFAIEVFFIAFGWCFILRRESKRSQDSQLWAVEEGYKVMSKHFRRYTYEELKRATQSFKDELGRGSLGVTYQGILDDKRVVAVKKLEDMCQGEEELQAELSVIGRIYHMNLVRIWGFCSEGLHRMLVYEFIENGSLATVLFSGQGSTRFLNWKQRFNIAIGVARGLAYLHHECLEWVIHCDVKPENILLDQDWVPKIVDFGLAKLLSRCGSNQSVSQIRGTRGYIAPEWVTNLPITAKADVYSYGVMLLELVKGIRISSWVIDGEGVETVLGNVVKILSKKLEGDEGTWIEHFVDIRLHGEFNYAEAILILKVAVLCLEEDPKKRPNMKSIVQMLVSFAEEANATH